MVLKSCLILNFNKVGLNFIIIQFVLLSVFVEFGKSFALLGGFLYALDDYYIMDPNMESGYGRADIILIPRNKSWAGYILELKRANTNDIEKEAERAFNQIEDKKYEALLKKNGVKDIVKIGIVFDGKKAVAYY